MQKFCRHAWFSSLAILVFQFIFLEVAIAKEDEQNIEAFSDTNQSFVQAANNVKSDQKPLINSNSADGLTDQAQAGKDEVLPNNNGLEQINSVSELSDVQPTDWAYQALRSLIERYQCISVSGDRRFRGNEALTRYEFASGLNSCLNKITQLIGVAKPDSVPQQDLATIKKLQDDFATELRSLTTRIGSLEARTAELGTNQFSTTTKLNGLAVFTLTGATVGDSVKAEGSSALPPFILRDSNNKPIVRKIDNGSTTFSNLLWLSLNTSFTGKDVLVTTLAAGNGNSPANQFVSAGLFNSVGSPFFEQTSGPNTGQTDVVIRELFYTFPVNESVRLTVGPRVNSVYHFDFNRFTIPINGTSSFNSPASTFVSSTIRGAGAVVEWNINKQLELHAGYLAESLEFLPGPRPAADPSKGLFNGTHTITAELTFKPTQTANIRLLYQRSHLNPIFGLIASKPIIGIADDGFGEAVNDATADTFGVNFDWLINRRFGIFGRYYYSTTEIDPVKPGRLSGDINAQNIQAGLAFPDLGKQGALGTLSFVIPFDVKSGRQFLASGAGNGGTQYEIEANYFYPLARNIALVPSLYVIGNINNFDDNPTVFVGSMRTQLNF
ncbi:Carbohydrate-selective porin OprB [Crinalium epipsammum PCC 9333]|uniref:Carbohydrate-selective porin OprB n=1 Tax=Crinalium epipsammum PCC 9333 TaxID=1173022 RepID=K9VWJ2_9CYAN|nr:iron uptake porin [Crinalium epipsammum]AFZ12473.1 Carbohydrate-selective porin OprB [Crinalium epipsammum PCC 9333]